MHTPGPWKWEFNGVGGQWALYHIDGPRIVDHVKVGGSPSTPLSTDMKLKAAAPDLLAALEGTQSALEEAGATAVLEDVRAVIAKARE